jgi:hypothetical protein
MTSLVPSRVSDALPDVVRAFDQIEALAMSMNDAIRQVTPVLNEAEPRVQNLKATMSRVGPTLDQLVSVPGTDIESRYQDGVLGSAAGRMVTKARSASRDLLDKGPPFLRAQDDDTTDQQADSSTDQSS